MRKKLPGLKSRYHAATGYTDCSTLCDDVNMTYAITTSSLAAVQSPMISKYSFEDHALGMGRTGTVL